MRFSNSLYVNCSPTSYAASSPGLTLPLAFLQGCQSYIQAETSIWQHPLPLAVYPLRIVLCAMIHFLIAVALVVIMSVALCGVGRPASGNVFLAAGNLPPVPVRLGGDDPRRLHQYRLSGYATHYGSRLSNPVLSHAHHLSPGYIASPYVGWVLDHNPLAPFIDLSRSCRPWVERRLPSPAWARPSPSL